MKLGRGDINKLIFLCAAVYFCSYTARINYAAVMVGMTENGMMSRADASVPLTGLFIAYGIGQLISGWLGDRMPPQKLIFFGLLASGAMNVLLPLCGSMVLMTVVWTVNGLAQAMMWPPLVKIMSLMLSSDDYKKASVRVSWGSSLGTIAVYLLAPLLMSVWGWRSVFPFSALLSFAMAFLWRFFFTKLEARMRKNPSSELPRVSPERKKLSAGMLLLLGTIMLAVVMQGFLRDGLTSWMPSYISEVFGLESELSVLVSVVLPLFSIVSYQAVMLLNRHLIRNEASCAGAVFTLGFLSLLLLYFAGGSSEIVSVCCITLAAGCMHGVNIILICMIPALFAGSGKTSFTAGLLNSCTYVGSAFSTYGIASAADKNGWGSACLIWVFAAAAGAVCCAFCVRGIKKIKQTQDISEEIE